MPLVAGHNRKKSRGVAKVKTHSRKKVKQEVTPTIAKKAFTNARMNDGTAIHAKKHPTLKEHYLTKVNGRRAVIHKSKVKFNFQK